MSEAMMAILCITLTLTALNTVILFSVAMTLSKQEDTDE